MTSRLKYVTTGTLADLRMKIEPNIERYVTGDFAEFSDLQDWNKETRFSIDLQLLANLDSGSGSEVEVSNSLLVWRSLSGLTPVAAREPRIWTRLSHVECLGFSRARWLKSIGDRGKLAKKVRDHFFGDSVTRARDDHSIGRLWWNSYIASRVAAADPDVTVKDVLETFLARADVRLNTIERPGILSRPRLAVAMVRVLRDRPRLLGDENGFREFMKTMNRQGGGRLFEVPVVTNQQVDDFVAKCADTA
jgi:hypothetical protein